MTDFERPSIAPAGAGGFRLSQSPFHLLRRAQQFASEQFEHTPLPDKLTLRQAMVLAAVAELERCSQAELVKKTGVDRSTMAEMIVRMEKKGLVRREASESDARAKAVSLTDAGRSRLELALPAMQEIDERLLLLLPRNKRGPFSDTLKIIADAAEAEDFARELAAEAKARKEGKPKKKNKDKNKAENIKPGDKSGQGKKKAAAAAEEPAKASRKGKSADKAKGKAKKK